MGLRETLAIEKKKHLLTKLTTFAYIRREPSNKARCGKIANIDYCNIPSRNLIVLRRQ